MCLAIPVQITSINGTEANVSVGGITKKASLWLTPQARVGDYVLLHTGYAIAIVDEVEAEETLSIFREMAEKMENQWRQ
ncbi:HypC/HybG/HupF family hydrogenase formation chaperone [Chloroflexota bacterium]